MPIRRLRNFRQECGVKISVGHRSETSLHPRMIPCPEEQCCCKFSGNKLSQIILCRFALLLCACVIFNCFAYAQDQPSGKNNVTDDNSVARTESSQDNSRKTVSGQDNDSSSVVTSPGNRSNPNARGNESSVLPDRPEENSKIERSVKIQTSTRSDFNHEIYCR